MKAIFNTLFLLVLISLFISCEKKDSVSDTSHGYLDEPEFIKEGLIGYYPFNGDIKDYSGYAYHAVGSNPTFASDRNKHSAGAIHFNGISDFLIIPDFGNTLVHNEGTIVLWCKTEPSNIANSQSESVVFSMVDSIRSSFLFSSRMGAFEYSFGNYPLLGGGSLLSGIDKEGFKLFVLSFTDNSITLYDYANGVYQKETRSNAGYSFGFTGDRMDQDLYLGKSMIETFDSDAFDHIFTYFKGDIDDLLIYDRILTDDEIAYFFNPVKQ